MLASWAKEILRLHRGQVRGNDVIIQTCPYCHNRKWNFEISLTKNVVHCWVCGVGSGVAKFLRDQGIHFDYDEVKTVRVEKKEETEIVLPNNKKIIGNDSRIALSAKKYLESRGMDEEQIAEWDVRVGIGDDIGFDYFSYIIFPFYGIEKMEYYCAVNPSLKNKYRLPASSKDHFVPVKRGNNYIVLVEGLFDGTAVNQHTGFDVMILFGKFIGPKQLELLVASNYDRIVCCLDGDAAKENLELAEKIYKAGGKSFVASLPKDEDPGELQDRVEGYINCARIFSLVLKSKLRRERILNGI